MQKLLVSSIKKFLTEIIRLFYFDIRLSAIHAIYLRKLRENDYAEIFINLNDSFIFISRITK